MRRRWKNCLLVGVFAAALVAGGCGSDDTGSTDNDDPGWDFDAGTGDTGDVGHPDDTGLEDTGPGEDVGDDDADAGYEDDTDTDVPDDAPEALDDFVVCEADFDCPINGSNCVDEITFNRTDSDGTQEIAVAELFDDVMEGEGICTRNCGEDPTVCDTVHWSDPGGEAHASSCLVVATGLKPYEVLSEDPFEVELDFDEMEQGQTFGALCLPPFDYAEGRSEDFCASCDMEEDCGDGTVCYNALTQDLRDSADELGDSFCVESCEDQADCPMGFDCASVGDGEDDGSYCLPVEDTCTDCVDRDENGFGTGHCGSEDQRQTSFDCDDTNPEAFYDPEDMERPFPEYCYDDPEDERFFYDLNCSGILDHEEQIGVDQYPEEHCTACGDECTGEVDDGHRVCKEDDDGQPYCGVGCEPGFATCDGDPADGCPIDIEAEKAEGEDQLYRDEESPYVWYDADDGDDWAHEDAEPHFFCSQQQAEAALDNPVQRRGCHPQGEWERHPERTQYCVDVDVTCDGQTGLEDSTVEDTIGGSTYTVGDSCDTGQPGICSDGTAQCTSSEMECLPTTSPENPPTCSSEDTSCSGSPDSDEDTFRVGSDSLTLVDSNGNESTPGSSEHVDVGQDCVVKDSDGDPLLGECRIGEVRCGGSGLYCHQTTEPKPEEPGFDGVDRSCQGVDRYLNDDGEPHVIFVDSGDNSPTLTEAIDLAEDCGLTIGGEQIPCDVFVEGTSLTTEGTITLSEGLHVYGGFDTSSWDFTDEQNFEFPDYDSSLGMSEVTVTFGDIENTSEVALGLFIPASVSDETHFWGIDIETEDLSDYRSCKANVGAICASCDGIYLKQVSITAGAAPQGTDGFSGGSGSNAHPPGSTLGARSGVYSSASAPWSVTNFGGGGGHYDGGHPAVNATDDGRPGEPTGSAHGGDGGDGYAPGGDGSPGQASSPGSTSDTSTYDASYSSLIHGDSCPNAARPTPEALAHGGAGGGSGAGCDLSMQDCAVAGGGGGGQAGGSGAGGRAGGLSIGFWLQNTDLDPDGDGAQFDAVSVTGGSGGAGGEGGPGGEGGDGASGAQEVFGAGAVRGGDGAGGAGGPGGVGGNGGQSIGLVRYQSSRESGVDITSVTGNGGSGGAGGDGGSGGSGPAGDGEEGNSGPQGESGQSCSEFRADSPGMPWELASDSDCL